ncbi:hypothetical protein CAL7716_103670 (plasmid) [Calothrix sp. PCC 7716]|nr:hypothetical protein CAL7716_103670 [Calothrix sp. PCC 7716]
MQSKVLLIRGQDNLIVQADLLQLTQKHASDYTSQWKDLLRQYAQEDKWWDWEFKLQSIINKQGNREGYAIEYEGETQGLMMIEVEMHGSQITRGKRLVYIDGVASAPLNRVKIQNPPKLRGVGSTLLMFARRRSLELGYEGRVGLHALPDAEEFYDDQGMLDLGKDGDYEDLTYFEYGVWRSRR